MGFLFAVILELPIAIFPLRYIACNLSLGFSGFLFAMSIAKDIKTSLHSIDMRVKANKTPSIIIFKQMCKLIHFTALKPLSSSLANFRIIFDMTKGYRMIFDKTMFLFPEYCIVFWTYIRFPWRFSFWVVVVSKFIKYFSRKKKGRHSWSVRQILQ